ncbi:hypothetical protein S245_016579, partial [Arachis hypogaea]
DKVENLQICSLFDCWYCLHVTGKTTRETDIRNKIVNVQSFFKLLEAQRCTTFLLGLTQQLGMMFDTTHVFATTIYIGHVVIVLIYVLWNLNCFSRLACKLQWKDSYLKLEIYY